MISNTDIFFNLNQFTERANDKWLDGKNKRNVIEGGGHAGCGKGHHSNVKWSTSQPTICYIFLVPAFSAVMMNPAF
jgi:hypothetical protein